MIQKFRLTLFLFGISCGECRQVIRFNFFIFYLIKYLKPYSYLMLTVISQLKRFDLFTLFRFGAKYQISFMLVWKFRKFVMISFWSSRSSNIRKLLVGLNYVFESVHFKQMRKLVELCTKISFIIKYFYVIFAVSMIYEENAFFILFNNVMILNEMKFITCEKVHLKNWLWWMISGSAFSTVTHFSTYLIFRYYVMCFNSIHHIQGCTKNSHWLPDMDSNYWNWFLLNYEIISHKSYVGLIGMSESNLSYVIIKLLI